MVPDRRRISAVLGRMLRGWAESVPGMRAYRLGTVRRWRRQAGAASRRRARALLSSQTATGAAARARTQAHWGAVMGTVPKTAWRGGRHSTASCMAAPARKARFMALLEHTPIWNRDWRSLRTSKAWKSWHRVRVAKAMVLAAAPPPEGRTCSPSR